MIRPFRLGILIVCSALLLAGCTETERTIRPLDRLATVAPAKPLVVTAPFTPHVFGNSVMTQTVEQAEARGAAEVNWTEGVMVVQGKGYLPDRAISLSQRELAAKRAARVVALRNAVREAARIAADADMTVAGIQGVGAGRIRAVVSGFTDVGEAEKFTDPDGRVGYKLKVAVPLWGVRGLGPASFADYHRWVRWQRSSLARYTLTVVSGDGVKKVKVIVIDARGLPLRPALWGELIDPAGKVVLDYTTVPGGRCLTYARTEADLATLKVERVVIKATKVTGKSGSRIVITETDATMLATTPVTAQCLREGKVIVLTDTKWESSAD